MIMKKLSLVLTALVTFASFSMASELKVAVVDLSKAFQDYYKTKEAEETLNERRGAFQKERQDMMNDYQKMVDETQKLRQAAEDKTLSDAAREDKKKAFETKVQDVRNQENKIRTFEQTRGRQLDDQFMRMRTSIVDEIRKAVQDYAAREKYNLLLDKSAAGVSQTPFLLYSNDVKDITDDIVKSINANKSAASKPAATPAPTPAPAKK